MVAKRALSRRYDSDISVDPHQADVVPSAGYVIPTKTKLNELLIYLLYVVRELKWLFSRRRRMDQKTLAERIPDRAAKIFAIGVFIIIASLFALALTESHLPELVIAGGLALVAIGLQMGERAIASGRRTQ